MIPNLTKGRGIKGTALYVLHDQRTPEQRAQDPAQQTADRIGMTATRNLSTDDPDLAWRLMCATAKDRDALKAAAGIHKGGKPAKYEVGHLSLSWDHSQRPDRAEMLRAAEGALTVLGWQKAQALIVEHRDHDHAHCHIVVNLVDPDTGRALPNVKNDQKVLQRWAHEYDAAQGNVVCKERAAKYERETQQATERQQRSGDQPAPEQQPASRRKKWLPRAEWEAQRQAANDAGTPPKPDRAACQSDRVGRYREAAQQVRDQMRPEWAEHYRNQRHQERMLERAQRATMRELNQAATMRRAPTPTPYGREARGMGADRRHNLTAFYNANTALIWEGIAPDKRPSSVAAILNKPALKRAVEAAHEKQRATLSASFATAKQELQSRHEAARIEAQRSAWTRPASAPEHDHGAAASRAKNAQRAGDQAAQAGQKPSARTDHEQRRPANESQERPQAKPPRDELAEARARATAEAEKLAAMRAARQRQRGGRGSRGYEREPGQD